MAIKSSLVLSHLLHGNLFAKQHAEIITNNKIAKQKLKYYLAGFNAALFH